MLVSAFLPLEKRTTSLSEARQSTEEGFKSGTTKIYIKIDPILGRGLALSFEFDYGIFLACRFTSSSMAGGYQ